MIVILEVKGALQAPTSSLRFLLTHCNRIAQCAVWAVRWPCGILAVAVKTLSHGKTMFLRLFFLCSFQKKT